MMVMNAGSNSAGRARRLNGLVAISVVSLQFRPTSWTVSHYIALFSELIFAMITLAIIDVKQITALHRTTTQLWHKQEIDNPHRDLLYLVCEQHKFNYLLWHEEDIARSRDVGDRRIAEVKRAIDGYNQKRNDAIEKIDDYLKRELESRGIVPIDAAKLNTETPGQAIDRLSILALRIYHMEEQLERDDVDAEHRAGVTAKVGNSAHAARRSVGRAARTFDRHFRRSQAAEALSAVQNV